MWLWTLVVVGMLFSALMAIAYYFDRKFMALIFWCAATLSISVPVVYYFNDNLTKTTKAEEQIETAIVEEAKQIFNTNEIAISIVKKIEKNKYEVIIGDNLYNAYVEYNKKDNDIKQVKFLKIGEFEGRKL